MKLEFGVINGECIEKKKIGGHNLKKKDKLFVVCCTASTRQSLCLPCASLKHTANPDFVVCLTAAHDKRWRQGVGVSVGFAHGKCWSSPSKIFWENDTVVLSFLFDKYYLIIE